MKTLPTIVLLLAGTAQACEVYPNGPVDNRCVELRAQGITAIPAQPKYQSAQDRCTHLDYYGGNTRFACVPLSMRSGSGYEGSETSFGLEPTRF